jgi:Uncharacterized protein conserved in bacteria
MSEGKRDISAELERLAAMSDDDIDYSDIPPVRDWSGAVRGKFYIPPGTPVTYRITKQPVSIRLDADVIDWFKAREDKYQTAVNRVLRDYMVAHGGPEAPPGPTNTKKSA